MLPVIAMLSALLAMRSSWAYVSSWTLAEINDAIHKWPRRKSPLFSFVQQYNDGMYPNLIENSLLPSPSGNNEWTYEELKEGLERSPDSFPDNVNATAYKEVLEKAMFYGRLKNKETVLVLDPSISILTWPLGDLTEHINGYGPPLDHEFIEELRDRRAILLKGIAAGKHWDSIGVITAPENFKEAIHSIKL